MTKWIIALFYTRLIGFKIESVNNSILVDSINEKLYLRHSVFELMSDTTFYKSVFIKEIETLQRECTKIGYTFNESDNEEQESIEVPKFGNIYEETNDWIVDFNKEFDTKRNENNDINTYDNNPFANFIKYLYVSFYQFFSCKN